MMISTIYCTCTNTKIYYDSKILRILHTSVMTSRGLMTISKIWIYIKICGLPITEQ